MRRFLAPPPAREVEPGPAPTFSVVIAAYQVADVIGEALDSIRCQTLPPLEVIVCDDGSTDDLEAALAPYRDEIVLLRKENGGEASAKNAAAARRQRRLRRDPRRRRRLPADAARGAARAGAAAPGPRHPDDGRVARGERRRRCATSTTDLALRGGGPAPGDPAAELRLRSRGGAPRAASLEHGGFDESIRWTTDWDLWLRMILAGSVGRLRRRAARALPAARDEPDRAAARPAARQARRRSRRRVRTRRCGRTSGRCSRRRCARTAATCRCSTSERPSRQEKEARLGARSRCFARRRLAHAAPARDGCDRGGAAHRGARPAPPRGARVDGRRWHPRVAGCGRTACSLACLRRAHRHDQREERIVSFELARRQFLRRHPDEEGDCREHVPSPADNNVVWRNTPPNSREHAAVVSRQYSDSSS